MSALIPVITTAGLQAVFNAQDDGLEATIAEIALGSTGWSPTAGATSLQNEINRISVGGERVTSSQIHLSGVEDGSQNYWVREIGIYLDDGTLFAVWSHASQALAYKSAGVDLLLSFDLALSALPANSVTIQAGGSLSLPAATTAKRGIVRLADADDIADATSDAAVTPQQLDVVSQAASAAQTTADGKLSASDLSDSTSDTSTTTPASVAGVKAAYDAADAAQTSADTAQTTADGKAPLSHTHTPSEAGLSNIPNAKSDSTSLDDSQTLATSKAIKLLHDEVDTKFDQGDLSDSTSDTSTTTPASVAGVKTAYDKAVEAKTAADSAGGVPVGGIIAMPVSTLPNGYLECDGARISRTTFAGLFAVLGTKYGAGDGSTTFNIPDYRGEFLRGWDNGRGVDSGRAIASHQSQQVGRHKHNAVRAKLSQAPSGQSDDGGYSVETWTGWPVTETNYDIGLSDINGSGLGHENRVRNRAAMFLIKY